MKETTLNTDYLIPENITDELFCALKAVVKLLQDIKTAETTPPIKEIEKTVGSLIPLIVDAGLNYAHVPLDEDFVLLVPADDEEEFYEISLTKENWITTF